MERNKKGQYQKGHKATGVRKYEKIDGISNQNAFYRRNREKVREMQKAYLSRKRREALEYYGGNPPKCNCCGELKNEFLSFDHINGGGTKHRRSLNRNGQKGGNIYVWLVKNNFPEGFQILCHNCNMAKAFYRQCPHNKVK